MVSTLVGYLNLLYICKFICLLPVKWFWILLTLWILNDFGNFYLILIILFNITLICLHSFMYFYFSAIDTCFFKVRKCLSLENLKNSFGTIIKVLVCLAWQAWLIGSGFSDLPPFSPVIAKMEYCRPLDYFSSQDMDCSTRRIQSSSVTGYHPRSNGRLVWRRSLSLMQRCN